MDQSSSQNLHNLYTTLSNVSDDMRNHHLYALILEHLKGKKILDIGCGACHFINKARKEGYEIEGIEPDKTLIKIGEKLYGKIATIYPFGVADIGRLNKTYDAITLIDVLEHLKDDYEALISIKERLNLDGILIIIVPAYQFLYCNRDIKIGHYRRYSLFSLKSALDKSGYKIEKYRYWNMLGFFAYLVFEKLLKTGFKQTLRKKPARNLLRKMLYFFAFYWMKYMENYLNLGFGLSLLVVAKKRTVG